MTPAEIIDALIQGTARRPLRPSGVLGEGIAPGDPDATPRLLALAVQARSWALPASPAQFDAAPRTIDPRPLVAEELRPSILRLVTGKGNPPDDTAAAALAQAIGRSGLRLHPFDIPRLKAFVSKHADTLGVRPDQVTGQDTAGDIAWASWETLDTSNWTLATPARKAAFIAEMRASDTAGARELVTAQLPLEKADVRLRLIDALATGLSPDDRPLLESLAGDRAPTVKQAVTRLLARLPGTGAAEEQIAELLSRVRRGSTGLLRKRATLDLQLPANVKSPAAETNWLAANFGAVGSTALADALGVTPEQMLEAARDDGKLVRGIAFSACSERNWALLATIAQGHAPNVWTEFLQPGLAAFGLATAGERAQWAAAAIPTRLDPERFAGFHLAPLYDAMGGPLPLAQARAIFAAASRSPRPSEEVLTTATALMPEGGLNETAATLERMAPELAGRARLLADSLLRLNQGRDRP